MTTALLILALLSGPTAPPPAKAPHHLDVLPPPYWIDSKSRRPIEG